ncbi:MAG: beta-ketoacyl synthase chain length factor [Deferribacteraceae bacterium]|nr:beta-ketoacyl synthase chain length factor [Deferribacteraceae bacterium]
MIFFNILGYSALTTSLSCKDDWLLWAHGKKEIIGDDLEAAPNPPFVPPNMRRLLDQNSKIALSTAYEAAKEYSQSSPIDILKSARLVFASRWGGWERTLDLLLGYIRDGGISPMRFSYSVHNAPAAVCSIAAKNTLPYCALSAAGATFAMGLVESLALFSDDPTCSLALYVYSDERTPELYKKVVKGNIPIAAAFLIARGGFGAGIPLNFSFKPHRKKTESDEHSPASLLNFIRFLILGESCLETDYFSAARV